MWLWGSRLLLEERAFCLPARRQLCSHPCPPRGWSSLFASHPDLRANFLAALTQTRSAASVVPSGTEPGCGWYLCISIFSAVEEEKSSPPSPSSLAELKACRNFLYVQSLATGSCTASLNTMWRSMFVCFPFILLPAGFLWWLLSRKRWFNHSLCVFSRLLRIYVSLIPLWRVSHHSPPICLCTAEYLPLEELPSLLHWSELYAN